ncbi:MAG: hypothetical protein KAW89_02715 [Armatimonadetes bacterium]|nr:hypothetical protein [Armatimonadota bacterium]
MKLANNTAKVNDTNLLIVRLPVRLPSGQRVLVPEWLIPSRLVAQQGHVFLSGPYPWGSGPYSNGGVAIDQGHAVFELRVPVGDAGGRATALTVTVSASAGYSGIGPSPPSSASTTGKLGVSAYNFVREQWETLQNVQQHPALPHPEQLMSREGQVLVKLEVSQGTASFSLPKLQAEVESF